MAASSGHCAIHWRETSAGKSDASKYGSRDINKEAFAWYHLVSPEYVQKAFCHLKRASSFVHARLDSMADRQAYPRVDQWLGRMDYLLETFNNAKRMLEHGDFTAIRVWAAQLIDIPRGWDESDLSWLRPEEITEFRMGDLNDASAICSTFLDATLMSSFFSRQSVVDGTADWRIYIEDQGYPANEILANFPDFHLGESLDIRLYAPDADVICRTGDIVPWTGVWMPADGIGSSALAFAIKGQVMQPAYAVTAVDEDGWATAQEPHETAWHPLKPTGRVIDPTVDVKVPRVPAGQHCPQSGWWYTPARAGSRKLFKAGDTFPIIDSDYGDTFWLWSPDQSAPSL